MAYFPEEILLLIFGHLDRKEDKTTILALCAASRQFHSLADPLVYRTIVDKFEQDWLPVHPRHPHDPAVPTVFQHCVYDLTQQPELARFLKEVVITQWHPIGRERHSRHGSLRLAHRTKEYNAVLRKTDLPERLINGMMEKLGYGVPVAQLAFLLVSAPNLEVLKIRTAVGFIGHEVWKVILFVARSHQKYMQQISLSTTIAPPMTKILGSLKVLEMGSLELPSTLFDVLIFLSLPKIEFLHIDRLADTHPACPYGFPYFDGTVNNRNSVTLIVDNCHLTAEGLARLLAACEKPHSLTIRWCKQDLSHNAIGQALRRFGTTLKFLHLDTNHQNKSSVAWPLPGGYNPSFGSFATLTKLHTLAIPGFSVPWLDTAPMTIVPPALKKVYVLGVEPAGIDEDKQRFEKYKAGACLRSLQVVHVPWCVRMNVLMAGMAPEKEVNYESATGLLLKK